MRLNPKKLLCLAAFLFLQSLQLLAYAETVVEEESLSIKEKTASYEELQAGDGAYVGAGGQMYIPSRSSPNSILPVTPTNGILSQERIWYVNGVLTKLEKQVTTMQDIANQSHQPVIGIRNASYGLMTDYVQTLKDLRVFGTPDNQATETLTDALYEELKNNRAVHLLGHSQGTVIIRNAINNVKEKFESVEKLSFCEVLQKLGLIRAELYGSPEDEFVNGPAYVHSCNYGDPVCSVLVPRIAVDAKISVELFLTGTSKTLAEVYGAKSFRNNVFRPVTPSGFLEPHDISNYLRYFRGPDVVFPLPPSCDSAYLYLMDTSGSMGSAGKLQAAKQAALDSLANLEKLSEDKSRFAPASVFSFAGECSESSTHKLIDFKIEVDQISRDLPNRLPSANGETPLPQAIDVASKAMEDYMAKHDFIKEGYVIVLSDGESTCGPFRPAAVYAYGRGRNINLIHNFPANTKFLTVGFGLAAGSAGERDLQYLAFATNGKYYNAADPRQLKRAFQKLTQSYFPKPIALPDSQSPRFREASDRAGLALQKKNSIEALKLYRQLETGFKRDGISSGELYFNLAQALEANDRYKGAMEYYQAYLKSNPQAADKALVEQKIIQLKQDYKDQFEYYIKIIESDLAYLKKYYETLFNQRNEVLASDFAGFVTEKGEFYTNLQDVLEVNSPELKNHSKDLSDGLYNLSDRVNSKSFDRDAISLLTVPISELEEILELLKRDKAKFMNI